MATDRRFLQLGEVYRYPRPQVPELEEVDGLPNFYWQTATDGMPMAKLERGITRLPPVDDGGGGTRVPAILLRSSPWKAGTERTPWHDSFDAVSGVLAYFGDNKVDPRTEQPQFEDPSDVFGNRALLDAQWAHSARTRSARSNGGPCLLFTGVSVAHRQKGNVRFDGIGVVVSVESVIQEDGRTGARFRNLLFGIQLLELAADSGCVDWDWISARRRPGSVGPETLAPLAWRRWIREGESSFGEFRLRQYRVEPLSQQ